MRTTALVLLAAAILLVAGCAGPEVTVTDGGTVVPASGAGTASAGRASTGTTSGPATPAPSPSTRPFPTNYVSVDKTITDTGLGHQVTVSRILRALPWPDGYTASSEAYELVAVELTLTASTTFKAPLRAQDLSVTTGSAYPGRPDTIDNAMLRAANLALLPAQVETDKSAKGWIVFRVDPRNAPKLTLTYTRPASKVTDTGQVFGSKVFTTDLVG